MVSRIVAEQNLANSLYENGLITEEDEVSVRRFDYKGNWYIVVNKEWVLGQVDYQPNLNKFVNFTPKVRIDNHKPKKWYDNKPQNKEFAIADFMKVKKIVIKR